MGLWSRTYVCCAVPLYNAGIYAILAQFLIISIVTGVLAFAAPEIVSVTTPSFGSYVLGILCILVAVAQPIGFLGVYRERPALFKTYSRFNSLLVVLALLCALILIIVSAVKHSTGVDECVRLFSASVDDADNTAKTICNVWTWIQIGIMGLLFVIVGLCQVYFVCYEAIYASEQKLDHQRYNSVYSHAADEIRQSGLWDGAAGRVSYSPSDDPSSEQQQPYSHNRNLSKASGLRNELARGDTQEELDQMAVASSGGGGGKLKKSQLGRGGPVNANAGRGVVGYQDEEEGYDYTPAPRMGDQGGYYPSEGGFQPPPHGMSSEMDQGRRW
ncbi:hypothetical protein JCM11641_001574 [Rhodosporidiobolus odoratus]